MKENNHKEKMEWYYKFQSLIYDLTRWTFLFWRKKIVQILKSNIENPKNILDVWTWTWKNIEYLSKFFQNSKILWVDISSIMLEKASKKFYWNTNISFKEISYENPINEWNYDVILFSYILSMFNEKNWRKNAIDCANKDLKEWWYIWIVDFHNSNLEIFKKWMLVNHVRMDWHLLNYLKTIFDIEYLEIWNAYNWIWDYFIFIWKKKNKN